MSATYYHYRPLPDAEPPNSPSRLVRPKESRRRRPSQLRPTAFILAAVLILILLLSFYHFRQNSRFLHAQHVEFPPSPEDALPPNPNFNHGAWHAHIPNIPNLSTASAPQSTETQTTNVSLPYRYSPLTFSLIMFSEDSAAEGAVLIKSIIMYSSSSLAFHIICDHAAQEYLEQRLYLLKHPQHDIAVRFYRISHQRMLARIEREGALHTDHSAGVPGLMKLFIHEILPPSVERTIFIDTDAFFISDPTQLWDQFDSLEPGVAISMPYHPDQYEPSWHHANRICSCIMLLDLARLRDLRLMDSVHYREDSQAARIPALATPAFEAMYGKPVLDADSGRMKYDDVKLGDQGYWWAIVSHRPEIFKHLSFDWEMSSCLMDLYNTGLGDDAVDEQTEARWQVHTDDTPEAGRAVLPKMLHFNCLDGVDRYYDWSGWSDPHNALAQRWGPALRYHVGFKWIWLNQPTSNATVSVETLYDLKFADEIFAEMRRGGDDNRRRP